ncbi:MAG: hypothetical protein ACOC5I_02800, partial [Gemmatimonadota bacterium]
MLPFLLTLALVPQAPLATDTVVTAGGPELLLHREESPLVALRLSAPVPMDLPEGSAELIQELARPAAAAAADRLGARFELRREAGHAVM